MQAPPEGIPYSRSAASLPSHPKQAPRKHLFHRLSSLSLFDKKPTAKTWHKQIDNTANGLRPVSAHDDAFFLFPWAQLRLHTDEFLRKQKTPAAEYDVVLTGLITTHADKVVALAACAHALSEPAVAEVLTAFSQREGYLEDYLQAFVAAGHGKSHAAGDAAWATTLVAVHGATASPNPSPAVLHAVFLQSVNKPLPIDPILRCKVPDVVRPLLSKFNVALGNWQKSQDWTSALPLQSVLSKIDEGMNGRLPLLEELLQADVPKWRHWAAWRPNTDRLKAWQPMSKDWLRPLWFLLGPNFDFVDGVHVSTLSRIILDGRFIAWLEESGITIGPGLLVDDTQDALTTFTLRLFEVIDTVCAKGGLSATFFWHLWLDDQLGLDGHTLKLWELARVSLFKRAPLFLQGVLQGGPGGDDATSTLSVGLCALDNAAYKNLRTYLNTDIWHFTIEAGNSLKSTFLTDLQADNDWFLSATAIVGFCSTISKFPWLGDSQDRSLTLSPGTPVTMVSLAALQELHQTLQWPDDFLEPTAQAYISNVVLGQNHCGQDDGLSVIKELHVIWQHPKNRPHRSAALALAHLRDVSASYRAQCLQEIYVFNDSQVKKLEDAMIGIKYKAADMCHCIVRLAAKAVRKNPAAKIAWAAVTRYVLETYNISPRYAVADRLLTRCSFKKYQNWVKNLFCIFGDLVEDIAESMEWLETLSRLRDVLVTLQRIPESQRALHVIFTSYGSLFSLHVVDMLVCIQQQTNQDRSELMCHLVLSLTEKSLAKQVSETVCLLSSISQAGFDQCKELVVLSDRESLYVAAVQMEVWLQDESMSPNIKKALRCLGEALHLPASPQAVTAKDYFLKRVETMIKSAHELESMRIYLKGTDRVGVATVLTNLGLEDSTSLLEEEIMDLPNEFFNFVEQMDDQVVELQFPLTGVKELQRNAMGLKPNESLVVWLTTDVDGTRESFCVHAIDTDTEWSKLQHDPIKVLQSKPPSRQSCKHSRPTRVACMIMRCGWQKLRATHRATLAEIYQDIESAIKTYGDKCLVCNGSIGAHLYRPTVCSKAACRSIYLFSDLDVRLADLHLNQKAVGLLLAAVQSAALAMSSRADDTSIDLLPDRPIRLADNKKLITMLDSIPAITKMVGGLSDFNSIRTRHSIRHELLFSWTLNTYQGFIVEATGSLRIPNMPNVLQFVLADSPPGIMAAFAKHDHTQPRQVLFHGTSMDRLFAILCQGLKVLGQTSLQVHGAVYGTGIYLAEEPSLAVSYSRATQRRSSSFSTQHAEFVNKRILLGIEYAGEDGKQGNGIYVAADPTKLLLRYIFLLPQTFKAPLANHVVPALQSNFHTLKMGARPG
ncbi:hypothetical protein M409DRAFT_19278 [Zasmidium cellare ATCC 36951]|uniref:PARP catalytic domain-containing protein n=1 Tax=Zasmidium cellare ATCC 36951 TaxID=1080233 RepID=A0A6A6CT74_ZASCE|nr:uncharacterized protein M409DRAFT_19278 [Zasmidium cellare ATCC 36951]KAF2170457.1 hypothetical protein M409DRAFT_19278 [Zasmidium cellare ATCC 36951]